MPVKRKRQRARMQRILEPEVDASFFFVMFECTYEYFSVCVTLLHPFLRKRACRLQKARCLSAPSLFRGDVKLRQRGNSQLRPSEDRTTRTPFKETRCKEEVNTNEKVLREGERRIEMKRKRLL